MDCNPIGSSVNGIFQARILEWGAILFSRGSGKPRNWPPGLLHLWRRKWLPTTVHLPGKSHTQRSLVGYSPWGCCEWDMTGWLPFHLSLSCIGEGNGNPLQCYCLENPRDREAGVLPSMGLHTVGHNWSDLAAAAAPALQVGSLLSEPPEKPKISSAPRFPASTSGSSCFMYCWSLAWRILRVTLLACEMSAIVW